MGLRSERAYPLALGLVSGALVAWRLYPAWTPPSSAETLFNAGIQVGAIAIGFIATAQTILIAINDRQIIGRLKRTGHYQYLVGYTFNAIMWWALVVVVSALCVLLFGAGSTYSNEIRSAAFIGWTTLCVTAMLAWIRVFRSIASVLVSGPLSEDGPEEATIEVRPRDSSKRYQSVG